MSDEFIKIPLIPLRGLSILPSEVKHFDVARERSIEALEEAMVKDQLIFLTTQKEIKVEKPAPEDFYDVGVVCKIKQMLKLPGDSIRVLVEGKYRAKIENILNTEQLFEVDISKHREKRKKDTETEALMRSILDVFENYVKVNKKLDPEIFMTASTIEDPDKFADTIAANISLKPEKKQQLIETIDVKKRLNIILEIIISEKEILEVENKINSKVQSNINKRQKKYFLKEKLKVIQKELGDDFGGENETAEMLEKLEELDLPEKITTKIKKEIKKLKRSKSSSSEANVIRTYIENILELPWNNLSEDNLDLDHVRKILNEDHYGLKDLKTRIVEYLAIRKLKDSMKGPIICLVGPPGVGKTSVAKSIARSIGREFHRMSLGGIKDESEIRGHRRTYIGAIPGRIINGMKEVGTKNPVFLFDEIDKISSSYKGDPASALLEVLDPEQNKEFVDRYLEVPFDLSKVLFITTANDLSTVPRPLKDRMEIIEISGYTEEEKLKIAKKYLVDKQRKENGIDKDNLKLSENTLKEVIQKYTKEAGVRELERVIGKLCRKAATRIVSEGKEKVRIDLRNIHKHLGIPKYSYDKIDDNNEIGVARGLAWTPVGGDTLSVEVATMKGKGKLVLTGKLGDVMKESAKTAQSYIRTIAKDYNIDDKFYEELDIHIHIPEGAIPKDGPSAGITIATAMLSALAGIKVSNTVAMTGEVTLRGRVLPIGGLKQKSLAAKRAEVETVLIPYKNKKNLEKVPKSVKKTIDFKLVKTMDEVLDYALIEEEK